MVLLFNALILLNTLEFTCNIAMWQIGGILMNYMYEVPLGALYLAGV